jgi:phospholipid/cholesterol/gamma-HCH transport system ATP-binding protein
MIRVRDIKKSFDAQAVLRGVSFDVNDRETLVILGKSGGGKSVLLKMIVGLVQPDAGSILVDDREIVGMPYARLREIRYEFGFLFQSAALFDSLTVRENIALAFHRRVKISARETEERVRLALEMVGLETAVDAMPSSLSGGMRKRVGLARAIAPSPRYVLYDEPTTGLDVETADEINLLINDLRGKLGVTSIAVTHDIHSAFVIGDRFAVLDEGKMLITGTRDELERSQDEDVRKYLSSSLSTSRTGHK